MNASRLLEMVQLLVDTENKYKIQDALNNVKSALDTLVSQPADATSQSNFATAIEKLRSLINSVRATFQPAQIKLLEEIDAVDYFARDPASEIISWVSENVATPAAAQNKLQSLIRDREDYLTQIRQLAENLLNVGVEVNTLEPGQAEIGFLLPGELFDNELEPLLKELEVVKRIIRAFSEASTGGVEPIVVRQISTSDPTFFFGFSPETIAMIGGAVTWALVTFEQIERIRKLRAETEKIESFKDDPIEKLFDDKIRREVENAVSAKTAEIVEGIQGDEGRKNEQETHIKWALESIISRVERGMVVEIRLLPPPAPEAAEGEEQPPPSPVFDDLGRIAGQLVFPKTEGTPVLQIPPSEPDSPKEEG